ncbi:MAG: hypothetical protein HOK71_09725 [Planctomycetaceae bacterium]|jgi:hypothetical protein|nr:hypothetical protein [Planctomycetaceae bacterium]MBT6484938.1 hypothetical protein [Planctomycetaceae bacterium]
MKVGSSILSGENEFGDCRYRVVCDRPSVFSAQIPGADESGGLPRRQPLELNSPRIDLSGGASLSQAVSQIPTILLKAGTSPVISRNWQYHDKPGAYRQFWQARMEERGRDLLQLMIPSAGTRRSFAGRDIYFR